jgi:outer membrane protein TolC
MTRSFTRARLARRLLCTLPTALCPLILGCHDFGVGGTGERVVPIAPLRTVEPTTFEPDAAALATTRPSTRPTTGPARVLLGLADVRRRVLANNLDLRVELLNPTIAYENLSSERAAFEALFRADGSYTNSDSPTASQLQGSQVTQYQLTPGLVFPLYTGGTIQLNVPMSRLETNNQFSTLNPAYETDASIAISQPLLRGFGTDANARGIRVAFYRYQQAEVRTRLEVIRALAEADRAYWRLVAFRQVLELRRQELELAQRQLDRARRMVRAEMGTEVDVVRAESGVADRVEAIIVAENDLRNAQRALKQLLNDPELPLARDVELVPADLPPPVPYRLDGEKLTAVALDRRMELLEAELQIAAETANVLAARNATLPLVSLQYTYNVNGLGDTFTNSFSQTADRDYQDHRVGLQVEVPIGNQRARSQLRAAIAQRLQAMATRDARELSIKVEVYNAVDALDANWQRILAARQRVLLAARVVDAETRQFERGLRTSTDVLDAQTRLADARVSEISAVVTYQVAQIDLAFATGTVLGAANITWEPLEGAGLRAPPATNGRPR